MARQPRSELPAVRWEALALDKRRAVLEQTVEGIVERVVVNPHPNPARGKFDPNRIELRWR